jgi:UDP-glucose 4-epimerase
VNTKGVLVTGGAGYIGSHVVRQLGEAGERLVVLDDLSTGSAEAVLYGKLVTGDVSDQHLVTRLLREHDIDTVLHFAANTCVPESVADPLKYYQNNTVNSFKLLNCCQAANIKNFIFSSTAAVYGMVEGGQAAEDSPTVPINPYGASKLMTEWMLRDLSAASSLCHVSLRYFNVAGADPEGRIGDFKPDSTTLIKVACETALGKRPYLAVFGNDYPTSDGTGIRDFIHVEDLADAHIKALKYLRAGGEPVTLNCGYGHGYSVREVLKAFERVHGSALPVRDQPRRPGDPPKMIAKAQRIRHLLNWTPQYDDLEFIVLTALNWEKKLLNKDSLRPRLAAVS